MKKTCEIFAKDHEVPSRKKEGGRGMITKMKKLTFLVYHKEYEEFLNSLRELGVVHIVEKQQGAADNTELQDNIRLSQPFGGYLEVASEPEA